MINEARHEAEFVLRIGRTFHQDDINIGSMNDHSKFLRSSDLRN